MLLLFCIIVLLTPYITEDTEIPEENCPLFLNKAEALVHPEQSCLLKW
jgi:hypothetical protein